MRTLFSSDRARLSGVAILLLLGSLFCAPSARAVDLINTPIGDYKVKVNIPLSYDPINERLTFSYAAYDRQGGYFDDQYGSRSNQASNEFIIDFDKPWCDAEIVVTGVVSPADDPYTVLRTFDGSGTVMTEPSRMDFSRDWDQVLDPADAVGWIYGSDFLRPAWADSVFAYYEIYREVLGSGNWSLIETVLDPNDRTCTDTGLDENVTYRYLVWEGNIFANNSPYGMALFRTNLNRPEFPWEISAGPGFYMFSLIDMSEQETNFEIYRDTDGNGFEWLKNYGYDNPGSGNEVYFWDDTVEAGHTYTYVVRAISADNDSIDSDPITAYY